MTETQWDASRYDACRAVLVDLDTALIQRMIDAGVAGTPEGVKAIADEMAIRKSR